MNNQRKHNKRIPPKTKLTKSQLKILGEMRQGSVIGELDEGSGIYELFTEKPGYFEPKSWNDHPFVVRRLRKSTVLALIQSGFIIGDNSIASEMKPFSRNYWYIYNG